MLQVLTPEQVNEQKAKEEEGLKAQSEGAKTKPETDIKTRLAGYIRTCWDRAKEHKRPFEQQMLKNIRQREGKYEDLKLQNIREIKSAETFARITETKCRNAKDWIMDIMFQPGTKCWDIKPTPVPELPEEVLRPIQEQALMIYMNQKMNEFMMSGVRPQPEMLKQQIAMDFEVIDEIITDKIEKESKEIVGKMKKKIDDQLTEGDFYNQLGRTIDDIITPGTGILKGPIFRKERVKRNTPDFLTGKTKIGYKDEIISQYERVSPFNIYPSPTANDIDEGYLIEIIELDGIKLSKLIGMPNYDEAAIRRVLDKYAKGGLKEWTQIEHEIAKVQGRLVQALTTEYEKVDCLLFWGEVPGSMLREFGMDETTVPDPDVFYNIEAYLIGDEIIKAILNPDPIGHRPYSKHSFDTSRGGFWGTGLPETISDIQDAANATVRAIVNNVGFASGPQIERNRDRVLTRDLIPFKVWDVTEDEMSRGTPALRFYDVPFHADRLMLIYQGFSKMADEQSGIPAYAHGSEQVGGAGDTASGLSMLMTSSSRGIKGIIKGIDTNIIEKCLHRQYDLNIEDFENTALIGDFKIVATGSSSMIAKEQQAMRRTEFMTMTQNPVDLQLMGPQGRKNLLIETARALEMDIDKIFPDYIPNREPSPMPMIGQGMGLGPMGPPIPNTGTPPNVGRTLNEAGEPVVGQDFRVFNEKPKENPA